MYCWSLLCHLPWWRHGYIGLMSGWVHVDKTCHCLHLSLSLLQLGIMNCRIWIRQKKGLCGSVFIFTSHTFLDLKALNIISANDGVLKNVAIFFLLSINLICRTKPTMNSSYLQEGIVCASKAWCIPLGCRPPKTIKNTSVSHTFAPNSLVPVVLKELQSLITVITFSVSGQYFHVR